MKEWSYLIYQIRNTRDVDYAWIGWDFAKDKINLMDYDCVYFGHIEGNTSADVLEKLFEQFNINHPEDFRGHSLSVSDIVVLFDHFGSKWYYCDRYGWEHITKALAERR